MKCNFNSTLFVVLFAATLPVAAQDSRFFRVAGPVPVTLTAVTPEGWVTWTNAPTNVTFTVQTATTLDGETNWVDWVQVPATNEITVHRVLDPNPPLGMSFIPSGSFFMGNCMGSGEGRSVELPLHSVQISALYMDQFEVTKALWDGVVAWNGGNGYVYESGSGLGKATNHPVHTVTWFDVVKWCNARSQKEGRTPCYYTDAALTIIYKTGLVAPHVNWSANGYRLPTEAEWEKAARGGASGHRFPWGDSDSIDRNRANYYVYQTNYIAYDMSLTEGHDPTFNIGFKPYTSPVGYFPPNGYGLCDMAGNVVEWCWDWHSDAYYSSSPSNNPRGPASGSYRELRGGGWSSLASSVRCSHRDSNGTPSFRYYAIGFRCVLVNGSAP